MSQLAERYTRLCHAYIELAEKFQKLDVEHMTLRSKVIPLLKALKTSRADVSQLKLEKAALEEQLQTISVKYEQVKVLELLLQPEMLDALAEAEDQIALVNTTLTEMNSDFDPDLSEPDKMLLLEYQQNPDGFDTAEAPLEMAGVS
ncbi:MAG TPA: hypothetical protein V6C78_15650 [Crinalium sp.]|jgi:predicted nuclease with TOPRIM domain